MQPIQYDKLTDEEIIERLVKKPTDNKLHEYFLNTKWKADLRGSRSFSPLLPLCIYPKAS